MRENSGRIYDMVGVSFGGSHRGMLILENGGRINGMVAAFTSGVMGGNITETGVTVTWKALVFLNG
jgi:hypothetical protein